MENRRWDFDFYGNESVRRDKMRLYRCTQCESKCTYVVDNDYDIESSRCCRGKDRKLETVLAEDAPCLIFTSEKFNETDKFPEEEGEGK